MTASSALKMFHVEHSSCGEMQTIAARPGMFHVEHSSVESAVLSFSKSLR